MSAAASTIPVAFTPGLQAGDAFGNYWLHQVTYRLRREICWLWHERGVLAGEQRTPLPPFCDKLSTALDLARYADEKKLFFANDPAARYLTTLLETPPPEDPAPVLGSFAWVAAELDLNPAACFVLALGLLPIMDNAALTVMAACLNDPARTHPTLALAQRLWDKPEDILPIGSATHPLFRCGLLQPAGSAVRDGTGPDWEMPIDVPGLFATPLLLAERHWPSAFRRILPEASGEMSAVANLVAARLKTPAPESLRLVPILGTKGAPLAQVAARIAALAGRPLAELDPAAIQGPGHSSLSLLATLAWLHGCDLFFPWRDSSCCAADERRSMPLPTLPVTLFLGLEEKTLLQRLPASGALPVVTVAPMSFQARHDYWIEQLGEAAARPPLAGIVAECARRFRCERGTIDTVARELLALERPLEASDFFAACRAETATDIGDLAQPVDARFAFEEIMLPPRQTRELREIIKAMRALTRVHYEWGTARAWNESGLCALFAGPPGTGKTMAAEVIARELDLPMYRIDLSQVVNKYIGETEKNLRRLFDAADASDVILFFDEADALFGKRTEVKDAHDRYANLEISYLLERMERFKGLGVLATNRKQDLDEAFLRRLRFVVDFPLPGEEERRRIWQQMIPPHADARELDFDFLARQFPLAGGHIRSIVFQACLQSAETNGHRRLTMLPVLAAVKSEYEKLNRSISTEQFGQYRESFMTP
jgi:hypothetical protein